MPKLVYADTKDSNMFYAVRSKVSDSFFYLEMDRKKYVFLDHREIETFKEKNKNLKIEVVLSDLLAEKAKKIKKQTTFENKLALSIFNKFDLLGKKIEVPWNFPLEMADFLRSEGANLASKTPFFPRRERKTASEVSLIKKSIKKTLGAFGRIEEILKESEIRYGLVYFQGKVLTSEFLKIEVEKVLLKENMTNEEGMIISSGYQTAMPHHMGGGKIKANVPIICDIFPKDRTSGYFADMTRTYVKGRPSKKISSIFEVVKGAQEEVIKNVKPRMKAKKIHEICENFFKKNHFLTRNGSGFIHGTGHSFGLDVHEGPYLNKFSENVLEPGNIITVEPGLYYPKLGGVRIEDDILVTKNGYENLVDYPKDLVIK